jgi:hypothetical protein
MNGHDDFEVQVEMRLHGALDAAGSAALDAHLASCASCRRFEALAKETETTMRTQAAETIGQVDWARVLAGVREVRAYHASALARMATLWAAFTLALALVAWPHSARQLAWEAAVAAALAVACSEVGPLTAWLRLRRARQAERTPAEMLAFLRSDLDRRIREIRAARALYTALAVAVNGLFIWIGLSRDVAAGDWLSVALVAGSLASFPAAYYWLFRRVGPLERERAELG